MTNKIPTESKDQGPWLTQPVPITKQVWSEGIVPVVSICCITYNQEKFIRECLDGFFMQETTFPVEVLIHDDASTDGTADIIREYEAKHSNIIKPIYQTENQYSKGVKPNPTFNFPRIKGKYIALCEGDDYWTDPLKLQKQVDFLEKNPDYVICYHNARIIDQEGNPVSDSKLPDNLKRDFTSEELMKAAWILTLSMCFRNVLQHFPEEHSKVLNGDIFLVTLLGKYGKGKYLGDIKPAVYRRQPSSIWSSLKKEDQHFQNFNSFLYIYQYHLRTADRNFAVEFLFEKVIPLLYRIFPEKNPINEQLKKKDEQLKKQLRKKDEQLKHVYNSYTYKVGNILLWPFKKIKSLIL